MDMSFFSRLLLCGRGIVARSMGSPFSFKARIWRFRWLYRKQYLTPTMILGWHVSGCMVNDEACKQILTIDL